MQTYCGQMFLCASTSGLCCVFYFIFLLGHDEMRNPVHTGIARLVHVPVDILWSELGNSDLRGPVECSTFHNETQDCQNLTMYISVLIRETSSNSLLFTILFLPNATQWSWFQRWLLTAVWHKALHTQGGKRRFIHSFTFIYWRLQATVFLWERLTEA